MLRIGFLFSRIRGVCAGFDLNGMTFSNRDLAALIGPLVIEQLLTIMLGFADILMVSFLGEAAISGVSLVDNIGVLFNGLFGAFATGGVVVCSHYIGAGRQREVSIAAKQLIYAVLVFSLVLMAAGLMARRGALRLIFGNIDADVFESADIYFFYTLFGFPLIALYSAFAALFRAQGNSGISMWTQILINIINIGGNAVCIYGLRMGVEGVAIPTLIARGTAAIVLFVLLYNAHSYHGRPPVRISGITRVHFDFRIIKQILAIGVPNGIENSVFQIGKILVISLIATFGTSAIAANAAAATISGLSVVPGSAIGLALLTVVGQCLGANKVDEAAVYVKKLMVTVIVVEVALNIPYLFCGNMLLSLFNLQPATQKTAWNLFIAHGILCVFIWPFSWPFPNALRAANDAKFTMALSLASMWIVRIGFSYLLTLFTDWAIYGVWAAMFADWAVRAVFFVTRWKKGCWRTRYRFKE
jgi:putative MATE family efflux protein